MFRQCTHTISIAIFLLASYGLIYHSNVHAVFADEIVNPHWSEENCIECHVEKQPEINSSHLRYNGDSIKLCNRCHESDSIKADIHPVDVALTEDMQSRSPLRWPLKDEKLTCLTCHNALVQMTANYPFKKANPYFLRGAPYKKITDFCFTCHIKTKYKKNNPHIQLNEKGGIIEKACLYCHQSIPDPHTVKEITEVTFKKERAATCISCHWDLLTSHPARADHLKILPDEMKKDFDSMEEEFGSDLPLYNGEIFCGTCHNPHQKGVIKRKAATFGAGEEYFLRLDKGYQLCVVCHYEKKIKEQVKPLQIEKGLLKTQPNLNLQHEPWTEKKCKICHAITVDNRDKPKSFFLCFQSGCHESDIIENKFTHEESVLENCSFCHELHSSGYKKLLKVNEKKLCRSCHLLLRDKRQKKLYDGNDNSIHQQFLSYMSDAGLDSSNKCSFCHSRRHKEKIQTMGMETCSDCHIFVNDVIEKTFPASTALHKRCLTERCSECHDAHASPYKFQLKNPYESYKE